MDLMSRRQSGVSKVALAVALVLAACGSLAGDGGGERDGGYWRSYVTDTREMVTSPGRWSGREWMGAAAVLGVTAGLYAWDQDIQESAQAARDASTDRLAAFAGHFGDGTYTLPMLGAFYLWGQTGRDNRARDTAMLGLESFVISGLFTQAIKFTGHRHRPSSGDSSREWDGPGFSGENVSFPSGHATAAFAVMTVVASEYSEHRWVPPVAYGLATLCAWSRVNDNEHWASDVFAGSAIGYFTAKAVLGQHRGEPGGFGVCESSSQSCPLVALTKAF